MPTPRQKVAAECARYGERDVVARCVTLIDGGDADDAFLMAISCGAAAKVIARRLIGEGLEAVAGLRDDPVPRVRAAAERALVALTAAGA